MDAPASLSRPVTGTEPSDAQEAERPALLHPNPPRELHQ